MVVAVRRAPVRSKADREGCRAGDLPEVAAVPVGGQLPETPSSAGRTLHHEMPLGGGIWVPRLGEHPGIRLAHLLEFREALVDAYQVTGRAATGLDRSLASDGVDLRDPVIARGRHWSIQHPCNAKPTEVPPCGGKVTASACRTEVPAIAEPGAAA